jgi:hypothetical protein
MSYWQFLYLDFLGYRSVAGRSKVGNDVSYKSSSFHGDRIQLNFSGQTARVISESSIFVIPKYQHILKMGTELDPETSGNRHILIRLSARENFIARQCQFLWRTGKFLAASLAVFFARTRTPRPTLDPTLILKRSQSTIYYPNTLSTHTRARAHTRTRAHAHVHAHTHARTHTHTTPHTHTHTHTPVWNAFLFQIFRRMLNVWCGPFLWCAVSIKYTRTWLADPDKKHCSRLVCLTTLLVTQNVKLIIVNFSPCSWFQLH